MNIFITYIFISFALTLHVKDQSKVPKMFLVKNKIRLLEKLPWLMHFIYYLLNLEKSS